MRRHGLLTLPVLLVAVLALALGSVGTATAGGLTKGAVKKIATKIVNKKATSLTVLRAQSAATADSAKTAASATTATTATSANKADTAGTAAKLATLPSGQAESGSFGFSGVSGAYGSYGITYPQPLASAIQNSHIIDTANAPDPTHCPGAGKASPGYLCLYFEWRTGLDGSVYGYSENAPYSTLANSVGVALYDLPNNATNWASGVWTVGAP